MFETLTPAPPDPILGLSESFQQDPRPGKINLSIGVYKDATGKTPVLASVKTAEERILRAETTKGYLGIEGSAEYAARVQELLFGSGHEAVASKRVVTAHTPGGTGGLRVAADFLRKAAPNATVWMSDPTWPNHPGIFQAAGLKVKTYPYFDAATNGLAFERMLAALEEMPAGDVLLVHGCCHNPTGIDPTPEQWSAIAALVERRSVLPLLDFAYQGFAEGLREDATGLTALCQPGRELLVASSFSKNFGLYNERVGALSIVAASSETAKTALSQVKTCVRVNYSNPPAHGAAIVSTILGDEKLRTQWDGEVKEMRDRINGMRKQFAQKLIARGYDRDPSFITRQRGMFSFSGLTPPQVEALRKDHAIYIVGSGRINVAGMTADNIDRLCDAIVAVSRSAA
ncbi:MAG: amino acid aminotransferase [Planctomycetia bacterium]|nr:amino acid aminotransferase [Planctomycetia bacterium]